jgi:hypothetical protein
MRGIRSLALRSLAGAWRAPGSPATPLLPFLGDDEFQPLELLLAKLPMIGKLFTQ